jgi:hypothetical protein
MSVGSNAEQSHFDLTVSGRRLLSSAVGGALAIAATGSSLPDERQPREVRDHMDKTLPAVVGPAAGIGPVNAANGRLNIPLFNAHGGFVMSAPGLASFGAAFDPVNGGTRWPACGACWPGPMISKEGPSDMASDERGGLPLNRRELLLPMAAAGAAALMAPERAGANQPKPNAPGPYDLIAKEGRPVNYGASVAWTYARIAEKEGIEPDGTIAWFQQAFALNKWQNSLADDAEMERIIDRVRAGLREGGTGISPNAGPLPPPSGSIVRPSKRTGAAYRPARRRRWPSASCRAHGRAVRGLAR